MKPLQIGIVVISIVGIIVIFTLPKVVVESDKGAIEKTELPTNPASKEGDGHDHDEELAHAHTAKVEGADLKVLAELKNQLAKASNNEKKLIFADSLSAYYHGLQQYDSSARYAEYAAELAPSEARWVSTGDRYDEAFNFAEGKEKENYLSKTKSYYEKVLSQNPKNLDVKSKLAMTYVGGEQTMKGVKMLRKILEEDPNNEKAMFNLGILSIQSGQYDKALERFEALIVINPKHSSAHFYRGVSYLSLGNKEKAKASFLKAKELEKDKEFNAIVDDYLRQAEAGN
jgi:outer membrane protein